MANASSTGINPVSIKALQEFTGITISNGRLFYNNGYEVMLNNKVNTKWSAYYGTIRGNDEYTDIENVTLGNQVTFFVRAYNSFKFIVVFQDNKLVQCYHY